MRVLQTVVSSRGFRSGENAARWALLDELMSLAVRRRAQLLLLPGGFLSARSPKEVSELVAEAERRAAATGIAIVGGVDVIEDDGTGKKATASKAETTADALPFFGFAAGVARPTSSGEYPWRQTSTNSQNAELVPDAEVPGAERCIESAGRKIGVLICGELFSWRTRQSMAESEVDIAVDLGHSGMGQGLIPAMRALHAAAGCAVIHSQHLASDRGNLHFVDRRGRQISVAATDRALVRREDLWVGWTLRDA